MLVFYICLLIGVVAGFLNFLRPMSFLMALSLAAIYSAFFFLIGLKGKIVYLLLIVQWFLFWLGISLYGHAQKSEERG